MSGLIHHWGKDADILGSAPETVTIVLTPQPGATNWNLEQLGTLAVTGLQAGDFIEIATPGFAATEA